MALNSLNLKVSQNDFEQRIGVVELRMQALVDVINRYENAKTNLDQFIESYDSNYEAMVDRINQSIRTAKKAHAALSATKNELQETVNRMASMGNEIKETISSATEATKSAVDAYLKIDEIL